MIGNTEIEESMMSRRKRQAIEEQLERIQARLANADQYLARNVNIEGKSWLHFADWEGKSGHPMWMRNFMIPVTLIHRAKKERALEIIAKRNKDKNISTLKRRGAKELP
jgi:hypothetical protein